MQIELEEEHICVMCGRSNAQAQKQVGGVFFPVRHDVFICGSCSSNCARVAALKSDILRSNLKRDLLQDELAQLAKTQHKS